MNFIEESDKYILRGLIYVICWFLVAPVLFAAIGSALLGIPGLILGIAASIGFGLWGYSAYLDWRYRKMMRANHGNAK